MIKRIAIAIAVVVCASLMTCCSSTGSYPRRACYYERIGGREMFTPGRITMEDSMGRKYFKADDPSWGDNGGKFVDTDAEPLALRQCRSEDLFRKD